MFVRKVAAIYIYIYIKEICRGRGDFNTRDRMCTNRAISEENQSFSLLDLEWQEIETNLPETTSLEALPNQDNPHTCPLCMFRRLSFSR